MKRSLSINDATNRLIDELYLMNGCTSVVLSTNVELRRDGLPYSNRKEPSDPGAAVYFKLDGVPHVLACDRWDRVADNIAALAAHVGALRGIERWGVGDIRAAFTGYKALPESTENGSAWYLILGVPPDAGEEVIRQAFRKRAMESHPDRGGSTSQFQSVQRAYEEALRAVCT